MHESPGTDIFGRIHSDSIYGRQDTCSGPLDLTNSSQTPLMDSVGLTNSGQTPLMDSAGLIDSSRTDSLSNCE